MLKHAFLLALFICLAMGIWLSYHAVKYHMTATSIVKYTAEAKLKKDCLQKFNGRLKFSNGKWICDKIKFR